MPDGNPDNSTPLLNLTVKFAGTSLTDDQISEVSDAIETLQADLEEMIEDRLTKIRDSNQLMSSALTAEFISE